MPELNSYEVTCVQADGHDHPVPEKNDHPYKLNVSWLYGSAYTGVMWSG
jgi:hypothetical protein